MPDALSDCQLLLIEQGTRSDRLKKIVPYYKKKGEKNYTIIKTQTRLKDLQVLWDQCQANHVRLLQVATSEEKELDYFAKSEFLEIEASYEEQRDMLMELLDNLTPNKVTPTASTAETSFGGAEPNHPAATLPKIELPNFAGNPLEWESFRDLFTALVSSRENITAAQKLHYLKTSVKGEASLLIENLALTDANFESAWETLVAEFDHPRLLIHAHLQAFMELPVMRSETKAELKHLRDVVHSSLTALKNLKRTVSFWDDWLVYVISQKFSARTKQEWNFHMGTSAPHAPTYKQIHDFMTIRIRGLEDKPVETIRTIAKPVNAPKRPWTPVNNAVENISCPLCSNSHFLWKCANFRKLSIDLRFKTAKQHSLCFNCLRPGHVPSNCSSKSRCQQCQRAHHSLLHNENYYSRNSSGATANNTKTDLSDAKSNRVSTESTSDSSKASVTTTSVTPTSDLIRGNRHSADSVSEERVKVLLPTVYVTLRTPEGREVKARALLDQGSVYSFVSESLAQLLRTKRNRANLHISGFGESYAGAVKSRLSLTVGPSNGQGPRLPMTAYVFPKLTTYAAGQVQAAKAWPHLQNLPLADSDQNSLVPIQVLIGADLYGYTLLDEVRRGPFGSPIGQLTIFGWVLSGPSGLQESDSIQCSHATVMNCTVSSGDSDNPLRRFWEIEEVPIDIPLSDEDQQCEQHFVSTHTRNSDGCYVVRLPFRSESPIHLGNSLNTASSLYNKLERRLQKNQLLSQNYHAFLAEYQTLGHMDPVPIPDQTKYSPYYIPHHPVLREQSLTTRLRVVFNASCVTSDGTSLNDHLLPGPKLQEDLAGVIMRWRMGRYVYTADMEKMFRQILVHQDDRDLQRILWRSQENNPVEAYRLNTVTYGTACAPFLSLRVLRQLVQDDGHSFPAAVSILNHGKYVDDVLFSGHDIPSMLECFRQINSLLERGGFHLRKWASNSTELLQVVPSNEHELAVDRSLGDQANLKVLGLSWKPTADTFHFTIQGADFNKVTKRSILSFIARLYDPLGWAAPVIVAAKIVMQDLWLSKVDWDKAVPQELHQRWVQYCTQFTHLNEVSLPRWTGFSPNVLGMEIHGFADASTRAYAAVVYLRLHTDDDVQVQLIMAKSKVAPIKTLSVPRLELLAAELLSRLLVYVIEQLDLGTVPAFGWSDSTVVLAWLNQHPTRWSTFVATRVSKIQTRLPNLKWRHVPTASNPADCASRGVSAVNFSKMDLWWAGPDWLKRPSPQWPTPPSASQASLSLAHSELRKNAINQPVCITACLPEWDLPSRVSTWSRLVRATAYLICFVRYKVFKSFNPEPGFKLKFIHFQEAQQLLCRLAQRHSFATEISQISNQLPVSNSSPLKNLLPFLDQKNLLRLGGRLRHSDLPYEEKFPILLPKHRVSELLIQHMHLKAMHGGVQLTLQVLRQHYWVIGARSLVKRTIRQCLPCTRERAEVPSQLMGDLPPPRVTPSPPFSHSGVDYAGPFSVLLTAGRGQRPRKGYVAAFACFATKAVHLEYVEDCSTPGFLAAFQRFASRRGVPSDMYSDNGTNFKGADRQLQLQFRAVLRDPSLQSRLLADGTSWHFIPAAAPHFGGLWESAVRLFKHHFRRIVGAHTLTQQELITLLCEIEACLNSRPLLPLSDDPTDLDVLTPGHFITGRTLVSVPEPSLLEENFNLLSRWQRVQSLRDQFWKRWQKDYLQTLHQRYKWQKEQPNVQIDDLVLVRNNLLPPAKWDLARVIKVHPGPDGLVRVVELRTANTVLTRPIVQICRLPVSKSTLD